MPSTLCALCFGEFAEVSARVRRESPSGTLWTESRSRLTRPDSINVVGRMMSGAEVAVNVAAVPSNPGGNRMEIYGREGASVIRADGSLNIGLSQAHAARARERWLPCRYQARHQARPKGTP